MTKQTKPLNVNNLISNWLSISMIFIIGEVAVIYGVISSLVIASALISAFTVSFLIQKYFPLSLFNKEKKSRLERFILVIMLSESYILNIFTSILILRVILQINIYTILYMTMMIFFVYSLWNYYKGKIIKLNKLNNLNFIIISGFAIILPVYIYLQKGIESVYHKLLYYHPRLLHFESTSMWWLFGVPFMIFLVKFLMKRDTKNNYITTSLTKGFIKFLIVILVCATFTLSFGTINIVAITENIQTEHTNELFILLMKKLSSVGLFNTINGLLYLSVFFTLLESYSQSNFKKGKVRLVDSSMMLIFATIIITIMIYHSLSMLDIYLYSGFLIVILFLVSLVIHTIEYIATKCH